jgi:hypothetical protein
MWSILLGHKGVAKQLGDSRLTAIVDSQSNRIEQVAKAVGHKGEKVGPTAKCGCGSEKDYQNCCGRADLEPQELFFKLGVSEEVPQIVNETKSMGAVPSRLDFILRDSETSRGRTSWSRTRISGPWLEELLELPDMANSFLIAARSLATESQAEPDSIHKPLACALLRVSALESFINQVAFFVHEVYSLGETDVVSIPPELRADPSEFQDTIELTAKWQILGKALCKSDWPPPNRLWEDFVNLKRIRNALVHFKAEYEQIVPPLRTPHPIISPLPESVTVRNDPHAWPLRVLTPSFANWCVKTSEDMVSFLKQGYRKARLTTDSGGGQAS